MKIKNLKYILSSFVGLSVFLGGLGLCLSAGCAGQNLECNDEGCYLADGDGGGCICKSDDEGIECSDPVQSTSGGEPASGGEPDGGNPPAGQTCEQTAECDTGAGEKWDGDRCKCVCNPDVKCCGVQLNMPLPFIGDCIELNADSSRDGTTSVTSVTAFPILMQGLMKLVMSAIMVFSFLMIIVSGLMIVSGAFGGNGFATGKKIIKNVIISLILLGSSGLILSLINPSFFGG